MPFPQSALVALAVFLVLASLGFFLRSLVEGAVLPWAGRRGLVFTAGALESLKDLLPLWFALAGAVAALPLLALAPDLRLAVEQGIQAVLILSLAVLALRLLGRGLRAYSERTESARPVGGIVERIGQIVIVAVAGLMLLSTLFPGVNITPLLTGLGVAGLATALALQDTLANFFAGLYLLADRPVRVGDYAKVTDGNEGYVLDVGWRSTRIRTLANNVVVIPNQKLAQSVVVNYHLPEPRMSLLLPVRVSYETKPEDLERALLAVVAEATGVVDGLLAEPPPSVRLIPGFGDWGLEFTLVVHVREFGDQFYVQHELRKRILERFRRDGIEIALPTRNVRLAGAPVVWTDDSSKPADRS